VDGTHFAAVDQNHIAPDLDDVPPLDQPKEPIMATSTIIMIAFFAVAVVLILIALGVVARHKRTEHRRVEAGDIRDKAAEQSHKVGQREALAEETAAKARVAQAESEAKTAHAATLQHQAQTRRSDAATDRDDVNQQFERADTIDPDTQTRDAPPDAAETDETPRGTSVTTPGPRRTDGQNGVTSPTPTPDSVGSSPKDASTTLQQPARGGAVARHDVRGTPPKVL
jgi:FtsZ-interacting cell division protein ZipA